MAVAEADRAGQLRLARYCARNPVALERLGYKPDGGTVTYRSDKATGPTAGTYRFDPLVPRPRDARLVAHIPDRGQVMHRYYGHYTNRQRARRRGSAGCAHGAVAVEEPRDLCRRQARLRWAELLRAGFRDHPAGISALRRFHEDPGVHPGARGDPQDPAASGAEGPRRASRPVGTRAATELSGGGLSRPGSLFIIHPQARVGLSPAAGPREGSCPASRLLPRECSFQPRAAPETRPSALAPGLRPPAEPLRDADQSPRPRLRWGLMAPGA